MKKTSIHLPEELHARATSYAESKRLTFAWVVRESLITYLAIRQPEGIGADAEPDNPLHGQLEGVASGGGS